MDQHTQVKDMELIHTSPVEIKQIDKSGRFGGFLFFSDREYSMSGHNYIAYSIEVDNDEIIDANQLFYKHDSAEVANIIEEVADRYNVDLETAENLIDESINVFDLDEIDPEDAAEAGWDIQRYTAKVAKKLGYRGVAVEDESGTSYMIDMLSRENELVKL